jgi:uncharacterized phage-like protein YoqJ
MKEITCCFTGHRPQHFAFGFDEQDPRCLRIKAQILDQTRRAAGEGYRVFVSGMALGVDLWAAEAVLALREDMPEVRLVCVLPCATQAARWASELRARHARILERCDEKVVLRLRYDRGCMFARNREMVRRSSRVIAVYDGRRRGGTAYTVGIAKAEGLEVVTIDARAADAAEKSGHGGQGVVR